VPPPITRIVAVAAFAAALAASPASAGSTVGAFKTPSRNIVCGYSIDVHGKGSMECGVKSGLRPPPPNTCHDIDYNDRRVGMRSTGASFPVMCAGDPGPFLVESKARVLAYGTSWHAGGLSCTSRRTGLTCTNRSGHGFFISRERWRLF
jgi:hypothetical protein